MRSQTRHHDERGPWPALARAVLAGWTLLMAACAAAPTQQTVSQTDDAAEDAPIPATARRLEDFAPDGWTLARFASADLDDDGRDGDALLLITRPATGAGTPSQLLAVVVREPAPGAGYTLAAEHGFLPYQYFLVFAVDR